jgi:putative methyltransferase (TIGR04325 family)
VTLRTLLRDLTPPILWRLLQRWRQSRRVPEWEFVGSAWPAATAAEAARGWNVDDVLAAYRSRWPAFVQRLETTAPFAVSPEAMQTDGIDLVFHNTLLCFAYALQAAAHGKPVLSMLDWGGGIGHYYLLSRALAPHVHMDYHCRDVPVLAEHGAHLFPEMHFYSDDACLERQYDLVLASASLHYSPDWPTVLQKLAGATRHTLLVTRLPTVLKAGSFVFVQRPYAYGYNTEYFGWCLNQQAFIQTAEQAGLALVREFVTGEQPDIIGAPERCQYRGYLYRPAATSSL